MLYLSFFLLISSIHANVDAPRSAVVRYELWAKSIDTYTKGQFPEGISYRLMLPRLFQWEHRNRQEYGTVKIKLRKDIGRVGACSSPQELYSRYLRRPLLSARENQQCIKQIEQLSFMTAALFPTVGYSQGMPFILKTILSALEFDMDKTLQVYYSIFKFYDMDDVMDANGMVGAASRLQWIDGLVNKHLPRLYSHLMDIGVPSATLYAWDWIVTLFTMTGSLTFNSHVRILDHFIVKGWSFIYDIILSILKILRSRLLRIKEMEDAIEMIKEFPRYLPRKYRNDITKITEQSPIPNIYSMNK